MAKRRLPGEGSIFYRKDKKLWVVRLLIPQPDGTKQRKDFYFKTRKEAQAFHVQKLHEIQTGRPVLSDNHTVGSFLEHWYQNYLVDIRDSTRMSIWTTIFRHIMGHPISQKPLQKATTDDWQEFFNYLNIAGRLDSSEPQGLSPKTQRNIFNIVHQAMELAVGQKLIWANPLDFVKLAKYEQKEVEFLTMPEIKALLNASQGEPYRIGILAGIFCGARLGEFMALTHADVKHDEELNCYYLDIQKSLQRVTNFEAKTGENKTVLRIGFPKTRKSKRQIPLLPEVAEEFQTHMDEQRKKFGNRSDIYLICNEDGGYIDPSTWRNWPKKISIKAGITDKNVHPHMLRHTFASHALRSGLEITEISQLLGHADCAFSSRVYVHTDLEGRNLAISKFDSFAQTLLDT